MKVKSLFINIGKLLLCGVIFSIGIVIGGMVVTILGLQAPSMPEGMDQQSDMLFMLLESPLLAAFFFGMWHNYGFPPGTGMILPIFLGWVSAKAMVEAKGFF